MLKLENITYKYKSGTEDVLKNINVTFKAGKFTSIIGPSGSGKTTLLSIMAGLDKPTSGNICIEDKDLSTMNLDHYRQFFISIIFQNFQLFPLLTAIENVTYPIEMSGVSFKNAKNKASELLEQVGIAKEKHNRYPNNMSGGEQQRVAIARALSTGAKVILADEPTGNLDKKNTDSVVELLKSLAYEHNYCVIVVTHNQEIADISDEVYKISDGVISYQG